MAIFRGESESARRKSRVESGQWVYGVGEDGVQAFCDFGIENLIEFVRFHKENPKLLSAGTGMNQPACGLHRLHRIGAPAGAFAYSGASDHCAVHGSEPKW
ncbi:hypothetical protein [Bradyrhizobium sp. CIR3A]|uniref:hypothetical protein n=1 Tax=Bradyrhizobium sp. CIR3A TaxID=2663838 RepID=UPI001605D9B9|nr:hypothetical protein [Bradyrhizobium sp. CIR3A]MBB4263989.1 hypothetical protein [Bradyrhizobium sp. CIR3A]